MTDLFEFYRARLDEQQSALTALRDHQAGGTPCINFEGQDPQDYTEYDSCSRHLALADATTYRDIEFGLADIAAKRRILDEFSWEAGETRAIMYLAAVHASHPDFRDEWRTQ